MEGYFKVNVLANLPNLISRRHQAPLAFIWSQLSTQQMSPIFTLLQALLLGFTNSFTCVSLAANVSLCSVTSPYLCLSAIYFPDRQHTVDASHLVCSNQLGTRLITVIEVKRKVTRHKMKTVTLKTLKAKHNCGVYHQSSLKFLSIAQTVTSKSTCYKSQQHFMHKKSLQNDYYIKVITCHINQHGIGAILNQAR